MQPQPDGATLAEHFAAFERHTGKKHPESIGPTCPPEVLYILEWFWEMCAGRPVTMGGYLPLPSMEIAAWCALNRVSLHPWELKALRQLDNAFLRVANKRQT